MNDIQGHVIFKPILGLTYVFFLRILWSFLGQSRHVRRIPVHRREVTFMRSHSIAASSIRVAVKWECCSLRRVGPALEGLSPIDQPLDASDVACIV